MSDTLDELLAAIDRALVLVKNRPEARYGGDVETLLKIKRVLEGLDPDEIDALLDEEE